MIIRTKHRILLSVSCCLLVVTGCVTNPYTQRKQFIITSESAEMSMGAHHYKDFLKEAKLSKNAFYVNMVNRVGKRIAKVANQPKFKWEFNVVESDQINAWCMPGGKIVFYTGIMKLFDNEAELAAVMGHEIAHAIARHGGERMSQGIIINIAGALGSLTVKKKKREKFLAIYGGATTVGAVLPFSRKHEYEADYIGSLLMAKAGYNPQAARNFWKKMARMGGKSFEFLSTHPADEKRIKEIGRRMSEFMNHYNRASVKYGFGQKIPK